MSMYIVEKTGELVECNDKDKALQSENVLIVISHLGKKVYTWVGSRASPQSKFACARETARIRMELGYRAVNLEESDTTDTFLQAVEEAVNDDKGLGYRSPVSSSKSNVSATTRKEEVKEIKRESVSQEKKSETRVVTQKEEKKEELPPAAVKLAASSPSVVDINYIVKQVSTLPKVSGMIRDYIIINDSLYIAPDEDTSEVALMDSLPDGGFIAENYLPRLYIENGKVKAIELWRSE